MMKHPTALPLLLALVAAMTACGNDDTDPAAAPLPTESGPYPIVDTGQTIFYGESTPVTESGAGFGSYMPWEC